MTRSELLQRIKMLTISALMSDDLLMGILVLKGGNALDLAYELSNRGSIDIDFSMDTDFSTEEKERIGRQMDSLLNREFEREGLFVFDIKFVNKPKHISDIVKDFWGGYNLQFKTIEVEKAETYGYDLDRIRREALSIASNNSTIFEVDISKYEYIAGKRIKDIDGTIVYVYTPEMLVLEKLRALCQQNTAYRDVVASMTPKSRARDFYDIHNLVTSFSLDFTDDDNVDLCRHIFEAKKVPLSYISELPDQREFHRQSWQSVIDTISHPGGLQSFDYYFDFVIGTFAHFG